jgi:putative acetyltransferase
MVSDDAAAPVRVRRYAAGDGEAVADVFFRSVREGARADYSPAQVEAWAPERRHRSWFDQRAGDGRVVLVAVNDDDEVVGYADLEADGHIDHMFCRPDVIGHRVGSRLYDALEREARSAAIDRLYVEASVAARRLFAHKGFVVLHRQDLVVRGVEMHNYVMEKTIGAAPPP